ncbi:Leucine-rich repeat-containing G-protein coupled receptor 5 [Eumeta japonica]|uniref:Leucine-rich repeat-containing G-protein coupled receptor 5 n=1 Tax=Eumeta variegata TaxID=151549 RepID=A0A4C1V689_EUMVA|nr:Leucine-rich repeat-containing G-protein coupled receptor 5 [Eumeta japonica]
MVDVGLGSWESRLGTAGSQNTYMVNILFSIWLPFAISEYIPPGPRYACPKETERYLFHPCVCEKGTDDGLFILCENAGLAVLSVGLGNIAGRGLPIEKLVLNECKISNLFGAILHRSTVRKLEIRNTPIETIDEYAFAGVNRTLQELKIINTKLKGFPKEAFKILGNLSLLYIDGHEITKLDKDIFAGSYITNRLEKLHIVNGQIADIPVEPFQHLKKLKTLDLHGNRIAVLKRNQFKGMREAEVLDLSIVLDFGPGCTLDFTPDLTLGFDSGPVLNFDPGYTFDFTPDLTLGFDSGPVLNFDPGYTLDFTPDLTFSFDSGPVLNFDPGYTLDFTPDLTLGFDSGPVLNFDPDYTLDFTPDLTFGFDSGPVLNFDSGYTLDFTSDLTLGFDSGSVLNFDPGYTLDFTPDLTFV